jgi:hypothetical protein
MARRYTVQPAMNDPVWGPAPQSRTARARTENVAPLRTREGDCYAGVSEEIVRAWFYRLLRTEGAPAGFRRSPGRRETAF